MFTRSPIFIRFQHYGRQIADRSWWLVMAPGLALMALALAILIWPELLAYLVAFGLLFVGTSLTLWGWTLRQAERRARRYREEFREQRTVYYDVY
ncbi:hypothetical protein FKZ61_001045 [Litorilinea aerophila]|uniref:Uncharacterized protein n=1 Tax=Litorilinea aerophila TaxID=1204385 RepID=A0A540VMK4_9CHLR|nr:hypothetical protein [Litorilinea aerophila]MCC9074702.1 hypothetical protein [Litorilinea aerophila]GIV75878.1 MAG: hypothetical protein KatS3mg050_0272 [Litorilinea sp.]